MVQLPDGIRAPFVSLIPRAAKDNAVPITLVRQGERLDASLPVSTRDDRLIRDYEGEPPAYFIHGPLVFSPAKAGAVSLYARVRPDLYFGQSLLMARYSDRTRFPGEELVVVTAPMFKHKVTRGYADPIGQVVKEVNGVAVKNLHHLVEVLRDCRDEYLTFRFAEETADILVFRRGELEKATEEILEENGIAPSRRGSEDTLKVWKNAASPSP
jgi:hypothetical protein